MLIEKVFQAAEPILKDRVVTDAVLGLSLTGIELDGTDIGLSYVLRERLPAGCSIFGFAQHIIGQSLVEDIDFRIISGELICDTRNISDHTHFVF